MQQVAQFLQNGLVIVMLKIIIIIMIRSSQKQVRSVPIFKLEEDCPTYEKRKNKFEKIAG